MVRATPVAMRGRPVLLPAMGALFAAYIAAHSPLQRLAARAVGHEGHCYFACSARRLWELPLQGASAILALALAAWAAWVLSRGIGGLRSERLLALGVLAVALVVVPAAWVGTGGWILGAGLLRPPGGPILLTIPAAIIIVACGVDGTSRPAWPRVPRGWPALTWVLGATAGVLLLGAAGIAVLRPPAGYDALSYHAPLAVYYWREGDIGSLLERQPWAWALAHPGSAELWLGLLRIVGGEGAANLGQLPYALIGALAVHVLGRRTGLPSSLAVLGGLAFLIAPIVVVQSAMQLNDLAAGALVLAAMAFAAAPPSTWSPQRIAGIGLVLGLAVTTKLSTLPAAFAVALYVVVRLRSPGSRFVLAGYGAVLLGVTVAPWWARNVVLYGNPIYPAALPILGRGFVVGEFVRKDAWFVPGELAWPLYPLLEAHGEMSGFGALFAVAALPGLVIALARGRRGPLALMAIVGVVSLPAWWVLTQHEPRHLLGVIGAGFAGLGWTMVGAARSHRRGVVLLLGSAGIFSAAVTVDQALGPLATGPASRAAYYEVEWGIDSTVAALPEREGLLYHTGYAYRSYAGDYPLLGPRQGRSIAVIDDVMPADSITSLMRRLGLRYAYVPARAADSGVVHRMYPPELFAPVRMSALSLGAWKDTRRYLFRLLDGPVP